MERVKKIEKNTLKEGRLAIDKDKECNQHYSEDYTRKFVYNADEDR